MKILVPMDFTPSENTIKVLIAEGREEKNPIGDKLIDEEFITRQSLIIAFISYWTEEAPVKDRKKINWQTTYRNNVRKQWTYEKRVFERDRHNRPKYQQQGNNPFQQVLDKMQPPKNPVKPVLIKQAEIPINKIDVMPQADVMAWLANRGSK